MANFSFARTIYYDFSAPEFSNDSISLFCYGILKMKHPRIVGVSNYTPLTYSRSMTILDILEPDVSIHVSFVENDASGKSYVEIFLDNQVDNVSIRETISLKTMRDMLGCRGIVPVYVYKLRQNYDIVMKKVHYGIRGIEGVVIHGYTPYNGPCVQNSMWLTAERFLQGAISYVWLYERDDEKAIKLLQSKYVRKERNRYLKKKFKKNPKKIERTDNRKNTKYLKQLFDHFNGPTSTIGTRLANVLARHYGIYNLSDLRQQKIPAKSLAAELYIGRKSLETYELAMILIESLPNCQ